MAWKDTLLDASFRGRGFHCTGTSDRAERATVLHEYPFRDGGEADDMGRRARRMTIRAIFWGDAYESELAAFIAALDKGGEGELIHPVFGSISVMVLDYSLDHDPDNPDRCDVVCSFAESGTHNPFFAGAKTALGRSERAGDSLDTAADTLRAAGGLGFTSWIREHLSGLSLSERLDVGDTLTNSLADLNDVAGAETTLVNYLDFPDALVSDMEAVTSATTDLAGFDASDAAGRFRGWQRVSDLLPSISTAVAGTSRNYSTARTSYSGASSSPSTASAQAASQSDLSTATGQAYASFAVMAQASRTAEAAQTASSLLVAEAAEPTLTPGEVEAVVGNTRARIQDLLDAARAVLPPLQARPVIEAGRDMALAVQTLGLEVINARPPLVQHVVGSPCNAHLLAHRLYGDYTRAAEILRLNPDVNAPNFLTRGQELSVYAE